MTHDLSKSSRMSGLLGLRCRRGYRVRHFVQRCPPSRLPPVTMMQLWSKRITRCQRRLPRGTRSAVGGLLDAGFEWTDGEGNTRNKAETLQNLPALATASQGDTDVKTLSYSQLAIVYGTHHNDRLVRIWVKRPEGWRAFVDMDTPMPPEGRGGGGGGGGGEGGGNAANRNADCDNPCKTVPYNPKDGK